MKELTFKPNFKILDCLRGIAALYVVINHSRGHLLIGGSELAQLIPLSEWSIWTKLHYALLRFTSLGGEFVIVFFVLSGFSIAYSLRNQQNVFKFYLKRLIRLYPPFIAALLWAALVFYIFSIFEPSFNKELKSVFSSWESIVLNLIYIPRGAYIPQFWSLVHEVIFYLLAPLVFLSRKKYYLVSFILYIVGWVISWDEISGQTILTRFLLDYNFYFVIGVWLFHNYNMLEKFITVNRVKTLAISILIIIAMVVVKYLTTDQNKITPFLAVLLSLFWIINFQKNLIISKWLLFLGTMSYTLYITHFASLKLYNLILIKLNILELNAEISNPFIWIGAVFFSIILSYGFFELAEKPTKIILMKLRK